jgi:hypothetical protein
MKIKKLVKMLKTLDQNEEIFLASDSEGNSISPVGDIYATDKCYAVLSPTDEYVEDDPISEEDYQKWLKEQALKGQVGYYKEQLEEDRRQGKATI